MPLADIFSGDAFSMVSLSNAIKKLPFTPGRIGQMGLFTAKPIRTSTAVFERRDRVLKLLPTKPRGAPGTIGDKEKRKARSFLVPHIPHDDIILASEVANVRAFGSENQLEGVTDVVNDKLEEMRARHELTHEALRAGALTGSILDADGSTELFDVYTEFGLTEANFAVDFDFGGSKDQKEAVLDVKRLIEDAIGGMSYDHIHCLASETFFDNFTQHADVSDAYARWRDGAFLREDMRAGFPFGGVVFEEYRGKVGTYNFIPDGDARFFVVGMRGLFIEVLAPAESLAAVNTLGQRFYASQEVMDHDQGVSIHTESNYLPMCTIPETLIRGHSTT